MQCLNIRATNALIGMNTQPARLDQKQPPADLSRDYQAPIAGIWPSAVKVDIDQYPCRKACGYRNNWDSLHEYGQKGLQGVQDGTARRAREGTEFLENGAKYNVVAARARAEITKHGDAYLEFQMIPEPEITVTPSQMKGSVDVGRDKMTIHRNQVEQGYTPGNLNVYLDQKNSIRMWISEGKYDIYA